MLQPYGFYLYLVELLIMAQNYINNFDKKTFSKLTILIIIFILSMNVFTFSVCVLTLKFVHLYQLIEVLLTF